MNYPVNQHAKISVGEPLHDKFLGLLLFATFIVILLSTKLGKLGRILEDFTHPIFLINITILSIFTIYGFKYSKTKRLRKATSAALVGFIVAYLSRLDLVFLPFYVIILVDYYFEIS